MQLVRCCVVFWIASSVCSSGNQRHTPATPCTQPATHTSHFSHKITTSYHGATARMLCAGLPSQVRRLVATCVPSKRGGSEEEAMLSEWTSMLRRGGVWPACPCAICIIFTIFTIVTTLSVCVPCLLVLRPLWHSALCSEGFLSWVPREPHGVQDIGAA